MLSLFRSRSSRRGGIATSATLKTGLRTFQLPKQRRIADGPVRGVFHQSSIVVRNFNCARRYERANQILAFLPCALSRQVSHLVKGPRSTSISGHSQTRRFFLVRQRSHLSDIIVFNLRTCLPDTRPLKPHIHRPLAPNRSRFDCPPAWLTKRSHCKLLPQ